MEPSSLENQGGPWLLTVAARAEAKAVLDDAETPLPEEWQATSIGDRLDILVTGVGKANAAAGTAIALAGDGYSGVINLGICGSLPIASPLQLGDSIAATRSIYADEGLQLPDGSFVGCADMGFPLGPFDDWGVRADAELLDAFAGQVSVTAPVATVSTCSGTDALASSVIARTWAVAEAMEGAAVGHVASRLGVPFIELRVVSNTTGDRDRQAWSIGPALRRVGELARVVREAAAAR